MLRMRQASAVTGARTRISEVAVRMVQMAVQRLEQAGVVEPDEERKAVMAFNLPVLLCGERAAQQTVNTSSLYQLMARLR
jgi:hypothetical protein